MQHHTQPQAIANTLSLIPVPLVLPLNKSGTLTTRRRVLPADPTIHISSDHLHSVQTIHDLKLRVQKMHGIDAAAQEIFVNRRFLGDKESISEATTSAATSAATSEATFEAKAFLIVILHIDRPLPFAAASFSRASSPTSLLKPSSNTCDGTTMNVCLNLLNGRRLPVRVRHTDTGWHLKHAIAYHHGIPIQAQSLIYTGAFLNDCAMLRHYHVQEATTIHLVVREPVPRAVSVQVHCRGGRQITLTAPANADAAALACSVFADELSERLAEMPLAASQSAPQYASHFAQELAELEQGVVGNLAGASTGDSAGASTGELAGASTGESAGASTGESAGKPELSSHAHPTCLHGNCARRASWALARHWAIEIPESDCTKNKTTAKAEPVELVIGIPLCKYLQVPFASSRRLHAVMRRFPSNPPKASHKSDDTEREIQRYPTAAPQILRVRDMLITIVRRVACCKCCFLRI